MFQMDHISDPDQLKQLLALALKENERLHKRIEALSRELAQARGEEEQGRLALEIQKLQEQMDRFQRKMFGSSSEKRGKGKGKTDKESPPRQGHGPREQKNLPVVEVDHELAADERDCPTCGGDLKPMGEQAEVSEEITVIRRQFVIQRHKRHKYRCQCNAAVVTAPGPVRLPGHRYSLEFAAEVASDKYLDHLPLDRQVRRMRREGLEVTSQTLWDQIDALAKPLKPTWKALKGHVLGAPLIGADETHWRVMGSEHSKRWVWCACSAEGIVYEIHKSRSAAAAGELLAGYEGIVMTDGYGAYKSLARAGPKIRLVHCWAHARRKFTEAESFYPEPCKEILELIGKLYALEKAVPEAADREEALRLRAELRRENSRPVIQEIKDWAFEQKASPESGLRKAIDYMLEHWTGLTRFLEDPEVPLDNNATERALRSVVLGRKNHLGSKSGRGTRVAALYYSLLESAKVCGVEPPAYLAAAARLALREPGSVLLPHQFKEQQEALIASAS